MQTLKNDYDHPIFDPNQLRINTPAITDLCNNLTRLVWTSATGAAIMGFTRAGKSTALEMLEESIKSRSGKKVPFVRYSVHRRDTKTIRSLIANICDHFGMITKPRDTAEKLVSLLTMYLAETAKSYETKSIVMAVDEAQRLGIKQIDLFAELYDVLREEFSISLTMIFIGNKEQLGDLLEHITNGKNEHIEGRFFRNTFKFRGLRSKSDVKYCLNQYDSLRYPKNGPTYTEYFLPNDYKKGFRLQSLSDSIWREFSQYKKSMKIEDWGMEYFIRSVNILLTDYLFNFGVDEYTDEMFHECIEVSGLVSDLVNYD